MSDYPNQSVVERIRREYPRKARVELIEIDDPYTKLASGLKGTVIDVDAIGTIHIAWDNGSTLGAVYGVDKIRRIDG